MVRDVDFDALTELMSKIMEEWEAMSSLPDKVIAAWIDSVVERLEGCVEDES